MRSESVFTERKEKSPLFGACSIKHINHSKLIQFLKIGLVYLVAGGFHERRTQNGLNFSPMEKGILRYILIKERFRFARKIGTKARAANPALLIVKLPVKKRTHTQQIDKFVCLHY